MSGANRYLAAHLVRRHWRATLVLGIGLGLAAAIPVTAWGVARRTDHAFPAFRRASLRGVAGVRIAQFCPGATFDGCEVYDPVNEQRIVSQWPEVRAAMRDNSAIASVSTARQARPMRTIVEGQYDPPLMVDGQILTQSGRARLVAGRLAAVGSADEVVATEAFLSSRGAAVCDRIKLGFYSSAEFDAAGEGAAAVLVGSLGALVAHPARYGFAWDAQVGNFASSQQASAGIALLRRVPHITNAAGFMEQAALVEGRFAPLLAFDEIDGFEPITPRVTAGRGRALDQAPVRGLPWIAVVMVGGLVIAIAVAWLPASRSVNGSAASVLRVE